MKIKNTKRALLASTLTLLLCAALLIGTTFAWFTDNVSSNNNLIKSGNLDVELYHTNSYITAKEKVGGLTDLFTVEEGKPFLWEPGAVVWENFEVANEGSLALKYQLAMNFTNATQTAAGKTLADVLKVAVVSGGFNGTREEAKTLAYNYSLKSFALNGNLEANAASDVYGIVIYWQPTVSDNDYNVAGGLSIDLGVNLFATQFTSEDDSFGPNYDVDAWEDTAADRIQIDSVAANVKNDGSASMEVNAAPSTITDKTVIDAPAETFAPTDKVEVEVETTNKLFNVTAAGGVVADLDITMTVNGVETSADLADGKVYTVTTYISTGLTNVSVAYTGTDGKDQPTFVSYNPATGELVFTTNHFSNYAVSGAALAYDVKNDNALTTIEQVVAATKTEGNTVVIPEVNQEKIEEEIEKLPEEEKEAAVAATAAAKIGDETYATLADAFAAAEDGDTIVLLNNVIVDADETITVSAGKTIVLDLAGKTIAGVTDDADKNDDGKITSADNEVMIDVRGTLTVKNGVMTIEHKAENFGWNACTEIFYVGFNGTLNVEKATLVNNGGSDMAYVIDMVNADAKGNGITVNVNNSTLKSSYIPFRVFNNGSGMNNVTIQNTALTGTSRALWVHIYSNKDNGGKGIKDATLNLDIFGNGNTYTANNSDRIIEFGFDDEINFTADGKQIVVATTLSEVMAAAKKGNVIIDAKGANLGDFNYDGTFGNGTVLKNAKFTYVYGASVDGEVTFENCEFVSDHSYSANFSDGNTTGKVIFNNCLFDGWSSFGTVITNVEMNGCTFQWSNPYSILRFYQNAQLNGCIFEDIEGIDSGEGSGQTITLTNCTGIEGKLYNNSKGSTVFEAIWIVDGVTLTDVPVW